MEFLQIHFPVAGIETIALVPPMAAFVISFFTSMAGVSGAFLLLPFQISVLGFVSPAVSSTNLLYNVVGTPGGVLRYFKEKRMVWPLVATIIVGTLPGVLIGYFLRVRFLPDPLVFKFFVGIVLLFVGLRLLKDLATTPKRPDIFRTESFQTFNVTSDSNKIGFMFREKRYCFSVPAIFFPALGVGIVGGIYGIGGGAIIAPFLVTFIHLPIYAIAGAVLAANFMTSLAGVVFYSSIPLHQGAAAPPDWFLGILFGLGGMLGMYCGAKWQRHIPERGIKLILVATVFAVSAKYIWQYVSHLL